MDINVVRFIDLYVGIPACAIMSTLNFLIKLTGVRRRAPKPEKVKRALFIELSEMGSTIIASTAIKKLQQSLPGAETYFLIFTRNRDSMELTGVIDDDKILTISDKNLIHFTWDILRLFIFQRRKFDVCFDFELFSRCSLLLSFLSGARWIVGFHGYYSEGLYRGGFLTHKISYNPYKHMQHNFLSLVDAFLTDTRHLPFPPPHKPDDIPMPHWKSEPERREKLLSRIKDKNPGFTLEKPVVILNTLAGEYLKIRAWKRESFLELTRKILAGTDAYVLLTGLPKEQQWGEQFTGEINDPRCINFIGLTDSLKDLVELFSFSQVLVSNDSGPPHFAVLTDIHIVVLFGPETPVLYGPLSPNRTVFFSDFHCSPCLSAFNHRNSPCKNNRCLQVITPEEVFEAVLEPLKGID